MLNKNRRLIWGMVLELVAGWQWCISSNGVFLMIQRGSWTLRTHIFIIVDLQSSTCNGCPTNYNKKIPHHSPHLPLSLLPLKMLLVWLQPIKTETLWSISAQTLLLCSVLVHNYLAIIFLHLSIIQNHKIHHFRNDFWILCLWFF